MISGPTIPNTLGSLRELVVSQAGLIEHGLRVLSRDVVLGQDVGVDALACDASGAPVLLFVATPETGSHIPARVLESQTWLAKNAGFLARTLADPDFSVERSPRFLVVGLEILADTLSALKRLDIDGLVVLQLCSMTVGGRLRLGVSELHVSGQAAGAAPRDPFCVPVGFVDPAAQQLAARFLDLARRTDVRMTAVGDRFSRRLFLGGRPVAQLGMELGRLRVRFPDEFGVPAAELTEDSCARLVDQLLRAVLAIEIEATTEAVAAPAALEDDDPDGTELALAAGTEEPVVQEDRFSLEPIRRSVARAQLSREEFSALGDEGSES